jgi:hypothetical protein
MSYSPSRERQQGVEPGEKLLSNAPVFFFAQPQYVHLQLLNLASEAAMVAASIVAVLKRRQKKKPQQGPMQFFTKARKAARKEQNRQTKSSAPGVSHNGKNPPGRKKTPHRHNATMTHSCRPANIRRRQKQKAEKTKSLARLARNILSFSSGRQVFLCTRKEGSGQYGSRNDSL